VPHSAAAVVAPRPRWSPERKAIRAHKMILTALVVTIGGKRDLDRPAASGCRRVQLLTALRCDTGLGLTISRLRTEVTAALASDDEVRAGLARWHDCMAARGYSYSQPAEAMNALAHDVHAGRLSVEDLRKKEIETAVVDTACYLSTGLIEVLAAACERAERAVLARAAGTGSSCAARSTTPWLGPRPCSTAMR
jgi:hypothetical protein